MFPKSALRPVLKWVREKTRELGPNLETYSQQVQRTIVNQYIVARAAGLALYPRISDSGFRTYSQFEEDGIILYVLSMIGFNTRRVVEMSCGDGRECMATNLILNHGFNGYLFEANAQSADEACRFFASKKDCFLRQPAITTAWITAENVNKLLRDSGAEGGVDLLSLDIDGNDYWVLRAVEATQPRLIVVETRNVMPSDLSLTIPYKPDFDYAAQPEAERDFHGVSLLAMTKLCRARGYRLIGAHRLGFNAFFLKNGEGEQFFPEVSVEECHNNQYTRERRRGWPAVKDMPWIDPMPN